MLNTTRLFCLSLVWMPLMFIQVYGKTRIYVVVAVVFVKLHEATQMFVMVVYIKVMTVKKSFKYDEYGSFEHLPFLFNSRSLKVLFRASSADSSVQFLKLSNLFNKMW